MKLFINKQFISNDCKIYENLFWKLWEPKNKSKIK